MSRIKIHSHKGVHLTFDNGCTISIQFGPGNYGDNYDMEISEEGDKLAGQVGSTKAEIAIWNKDGNWFDFREYKFSPTRCDVKGYVPINEVIDWINRVRTMGEV